MKELMLHINTALDKAYVCLSHGSEILAFRENDSPKEHAAFLQPAIRDLLALTSRKVQDLSSISVIYGPGSYTGLRVGLSAAKGLCFAYGIPLICISTLDWMAYPYKNGEYDCIIPMIDARRMEVFTAAFNKSLQPLLTPVAMILDETSFSDILPERKTVFTGNGALKLPQIIRDQHACTVTHLNSGPLDQAEIAETMFEQRFFSDLAYSEPFYLKGFFTTANI